MPSLRILGRSSLFAGDDIRLPMMAGILFRLIQIALSLPLLIHIVANERVEINFAVTIAKCILEFDDQRHANVFENLHDVLIVYVACSLALSTIGLMEYLIMLRIAGKGDPTHPEARKNLSLFCNIDFTLLLWLRVVLTVFGWFLATVLIDYCQCNPDLGDIGDDATRYLANTFHDLKDHCWMFKSAWTVSYLGLVVSQSIDMVWGALHYAALICHFVPTRLFVSASLAWNCFCQCCVGCLNCVTCFRMGGLQAIGSSDTAEFAEICRHFFGDSGIVDITFSDILAGLYITKLIHYSIEISVRNHLIKEGLASSFVGKEVGAMEGLHQSVKQQLAKDGLLPKAVDRKLLNLFRSGENAIQHCTKVSNTTKETNGNNVDGNREDRISDHAGSNSDQGTGIEAAIDVAEMNASENGGATQLTSISPEIADAIGIETKILEANQFLVPLLNTQLSTENEEEQYFMAAGARYIRFATSIYDWSIKDKESRCYWSAIHPRKRNYRGDHSGIAMKVSPIYGIEEDDIVYSNYKQGIIETPFAVVLDHPWKTIVVTIRGSASIDDFISDLAFVPASLESCGERFRFDGKGKYAHKGMLAIAEWIADDILQSNILDELILNDDAKYTHYQLVIVGHSLGAAASALVALFLRSKFPNVKAIAYEPPGCTVSLNVAEESKQFCISFVTGMDVIPRVSAEAMHDLRMEVLINLARIRIPKWKVMHNRNVEQHGVDAVKEFLAEALHPHSELKATPFLRSVAEFYHYSREKMASSATGGLHIPGRIIHMASSASTFQQKMKEMAEVPGKVAADFKSKAFGGLESKMFGKHDDESSAASSDKPTGKYQACWATQEDFRHIILSDHLIEDHLTVTIQDALDVRMKFAGTAEPFNQDVTWQP